MKPKSIRLGKFHWVPGEALLHSPNDSMANKKLTNKQVQLLSCLYDHTPERVKKNTLVEQIWPSQFISAESLPQLINRTRNTLEDTNKEIITHYRNEGYSLNWQSISDNENLNITASSSNVNKKIIDIIINLIITTLTLIGVYTNYNAYIIYNGHREYQSIMKSAPTYRGITSESKEKITFILDGNICEYIKNTNEVNCDEKK